MTTTIYKKIDADSCGDAATMEAYAASLRAQLAEAFPHAQITIETTERESGHMPTVIDADTHEEQQSIADFIHTTWDRFCGEQ